jgi:hypothetical protein
MWSRSKQLAFGHKEVCTEMKNNFAEPFATYIHSSIDLNHQFIFVCYAEAIEHFRSMG